MFPVIPKFVDTVDLWIVIEVLAHCAIVHDIGFFSAHVAIQSGAVKKGRLEKNGAN